MNAKLLLVSMLPALCGLLGGLVFVTADFLLARIRINRLRARGVYPAAGAETNQDVGRLLLLGHEDLAVRCYQAIHHVRYHEARARVLDRNPNNSLVVKGAIGIVTALALALLLHRWNPGALAALVMMALACNLIMRRPRHSPAKAK